MVRVLSDDDIASVLDLADLLPAVEAGLVKQARGDVERPERPHFPVGLDAETPDAPAGTGIAMAAYVHGADHYATKIVGVHEDNPARGLPTVNALVVLTEAATGRPAAVLAGNRITNARTGCLGGLAARELAAAPVTLGLVGAGTQARWQARAIAAATDLAAIRVYSPSASRERCASELSDELGVPATPVASAADAVRGVDAVVTATTATEPVFPGAAIEPGTVVVAVGAYTAEMRELDAVTFDRASAVYADVPVEVAPIGDLAPTGLDAGDLRPFAAMFEEPDPDGIVVVESVGTAVLDAVAGEHVLGAAREGDVGTKLSLDS